MISIYKIPKMPGSKILIRVSFHVWGLKFWTFRLGTKKMQGREAQVYLYLPKGLNFSLTSNISLRRKLKTQAESDFIHMLRYSDISWWMIQVKRNALWVMFAVFLFWFLIFIFFFSGGNTHETGENTHETGENARNEIFM